MRITRDSPISEVAAVVADALSRAGVRAVLTGGACAAIYSEGAYQSHDLDFIVEGAGQGAVADAAMASVGFARDGDRYIHPETQFFVEFPRGPLAIGADIDIHPVQLSLTEGQALALSATDSCRDRLAAYYHWTDRQSLTVAVQIALRQEVDLVKIRAWSAREGAEAKWGEFEESVRRGRLGRARRSR